MNLKAKFISFDSFASFFQLSVLGHNSSYQTISGAIVTLSI